MEHQAVSSKIEQLQAADVTSALLGLLKQAHSVLKPPSRSAAAAGAVPVPAASRRALVAGVLLLLERTAVLAKQQCDYKLIKDAHSQLVASFQQHPWLWELLLRKHLPDLLQHPAAAQLFAEALARLPGSTQARAYRLWHQQLAAQPQLVGAVPPGLARVLSEQLQLCFQARNFSLPLSAGLEVEDAARTAPADGSGANGVATAPGQRHAGTAAAAAAAATDVHVVLREQLPHLLQLLLLIACNGSDASEAGVAGAAAASVAGAGREGGSGHESGDGPSLSSMQSAATGLRPPPKRAQQQQQQQQGAAVAASPASSASANGHCSTGAPPAGGSSSGGSSVQEDVLHYAVLLVGMLSDPDALHSTLSIRGQRQQQQEDGSASDSEGEVRGREMQLGGVAADAHGSNTAAAADDQAYSLSRRDVERVRIAQALIDIFLDGILTLPLLAAAVHVRLHSKGSSTRGDGGARQTAGPAPAGQRTGGSGGAPAAAEVEAEEQAAAAAELRHTAGVMLALHRELSRFCLAQQTDTAEAVGASTAGSRRRQAVQPLSPPACLKLLAMLATVQQPAEPGGSVAMPHRRRSEVTANQAAGSQPPPALLLVPPQLVAHAVELVRQAIEGSSSSSGSSRALGDQLASEAGASWRADLVVQAAAIYTTCYQAMWGAQVLQSSDIYWRAAAQLGRLLRAAVCGDAAAPEFEAEAAAEAALLTRNAVGSRRRRQLSGMHEVASLRGGSAAAAAGAGGPPPAKRVKPEQGGGGAGSAVVELMQLFQPPALEQQQVQVCDQPAAAVMELQGRRRIVAVAVQQVRQEAVVQQVEQQQQKPARRCITPQQVAPAANAANLHRGKGTAGAAVAASGAGQQQEVAGNTSRQAAQADQAVAPLAEEGQCGQQRIIMSKTANMTDEEQDALWEAYIADKELMVEMLGDSDYQQWYDEAVHPLRRQQRRAGGLEAAWAAVLGSSSADSLAQLQLPRTLLAASGSMPWDAAAAACLRLLTVLLGASVGSGGGSGVVAAEQRQQVLQRAFSPQMREAGARAATRICHISETETMRAVPKAAGAAPVGGTLVLLASQLFGLVEGRQFDDTCSDWLSKAESKSSTDQQPESGRHPAERSRLVAPPLLDAYAGLLAALLPHAELEGCEAAAAVGRGPGRSTKQQQHLRRLLSLGATVAQRLLLLPPPVQHMLGPGCALLLPLTVEAGSSREETVAQQSALLWMLVQQQLAGNCGRGGGAVALPAGAPKWVEGEDCLLLPPAGSSASRGHAMLLGPPVEVQQAVAAELLAQVLKQLPSSGSSGTAAVAAAAVAGGRLAAEDLLPAADACNAAIQLLLVEQRRQAKQEAAGDGSPHAGSESDEEDEEAQQHMHPLLLGHAAAVGQLAAALCQVGATAGAELAAALDAAASAPRQRQRQAQLALDNTAAVAAAAGAEAAAGTLALCNSFLEPADSLRLAACLPSTGQHQLEAACEALGGQNEVIGQLLSRLPRKHPLPAAALRAMEGAPPLWQPGGGDESHDASDSDGGSSGNDGGGVGRPYTKQQGQQQRRRSGGSHGGGSKGSGSSPPVQPARRRKRLKDIRNPALRAMLAEDGGHADLDADELSDLEDFLVCNPERDYATFFRRHFYHVRDSESEGEEEQEGAGAAAAEPEKAAAGQEKAAAAGAEQEQCMYARGVQAGEQQQFTLQQQQPIQAGQRQAAGPTDKPSSSRRTRSRHGGGKKGGVGVRAD